MKTTPTLGTLVVAVIVFSSVALSPITTYAQDTYWGVAGEFTPRWESLDQLDVAYDADAFEIAGNTFRIGFVRGRTLGGEWGVSFVRKGVRDGSLIVRDGDLFTFRDDVVMNGVEINKFAPFGTIKDRVQIGLIVGGGVAGVSGTAAGPTGESVEVERVFALAGDEDVGVHPLFRLELAGAAIVGAGFKIRVSGGFDWPGTAKFGIGGVYFFGER